MWARRVYLFYWYTRTRLFLPLHRHLSLQPPLTLTALRLPLGLCPPQRCSWTDSRHLIHARVRGHTCVHTCTRIHTHPYMEIFIGVPSLFIEVVAPPHLRRCSVSFEVRDVVSIISTLLWVTINVRIYNYARLVFALRSQRKTEKSITWQRLKYFIYSEILISSAMEVWMLQIGERFDKLSMLCFLKKLSMLNSNLVINKIISQPTVT